VELQCFTNFFAELRFLFRGVPVGETPTREENQTAAKIGAATTHGGEKLNFACWLFMPVRFYV
jgi:hypothetical protein